MGGSGFVDGVALPELIFIFIQSQRCQADILDISDASGGLVAAMVAGTRMVRVNHTIW